MTEINFERLKDAYAVIDGIPESAFYLDSVLRESNGDLGCGTIACAAGWLMIYPPFAEILGTELRVSTFSPACSVIRFQNPVEGHRSLPAFETQMRRLFGLGERDTHLFDAAGGSDYDQAIYAELGEDISHKQLWQARVRKFLAEHGQLSTTSKDAE